MLSATNGMSCTEDPQAVGGNSTDGSGQSSSLNSSSASLGDNQIQGCGDEPPVEEVTVYGHRTSFGVFWWGPRFFVPNGGGGGGGGGSTAFTNVDANKECQALDASKRVEMVNAAFILERTANARTIGAFLRRYPPGSTFELTLPNGSVIRGRVSGASINPPIIAEADNSCE